MVRWSHGLGGKEGSGFFEKIYGRKKVLNRKIQNPLKHWINSR
jgi:hypothetical protein